MNRKNECHASASNVSRQSIIDKLMTKEHTVPTYECEFCTKTFILSYKNRHSKICKQNPINLQETTQPIIEVSPSTVQQDFNDISTTRMVEIQSTQIVVDKLEYEFMKQKLLQYCPSTSELFHNGSHPIS